MTNIYSIQRKVDNTLELSSVCRGEWCRSLESDVDLLDRELHETCKEATTGDDVTRIAAMSGKLHKAYRNLGPDIHI